MDSKTAKEILAEIKIMNGSLNQIAIALGTRTIVQLLVNEIDPDKLSHALEKVLRDQVKRHG